MIQMSKFVSLPCDAKAMNRPSADQSVTNVTLVELPERRLGSLSVGGSLDEVVADGVDDPAAVRRERRHAGVARARN